MAEKDFLKRKEEELKAQFSEPTYVDFTIKYVKDLQKYDVRISNSFSIFDYLAIGIACLAKAIQNSKEKVIYVFLHQYANMEDIRLHDRLFSPISANQSSAPNAVIDMLDETALIIDTYFHKNPLTALDIYQIVVEISKASNLTFSNFNDILEAQKLAFSTIQKYAISTCLESFRAFFSSDD